MKNILVICSGRNAVGVENRLSDFCEGFFVIWLLEAGGSFAVNSN
jgi:hypothetical protein